MLTMFAAALLGVGAGIVIPLVTKAIVDGPVARGERSLLLPLALVGFGLGAVEAILTFVRRWIQSTAVLGMETAIRSDLYRRLQRLPVSFHDRWQSGQLLSRAVTDLGVIRRFIGFGFIFLIVNLLTYATVLVLLLRLSVPLGLIVLVATLPILAISRSWTRQYFVISRRVQDQQGDLATVVEESAGGVRVVKAFGRRELVDARFGEVAGRLAGSWMDAVRLRARFWTLLDVIPNLALAVVLCVGALAVAKGLLSLGGLIAFLSLQLQLVWPIDALGWILAIGQEAATAAERVYEVLDTPVGSADLPVLHDVSLEVEPGETLALVGATGSGKTTLVSLVPRLYDVTQGRITLDGHDLRGLRLESLRRVVAVGFEEPILFSASVRENLVLGIAEATEEEIATALEVAKAEFVFELPWGLDTRIGEQGLSLSGGQRQRLALARAVLARPRVLVLDDPLSALDVHTEALVEEALARVLAGTTGLVVVHRPSTLALADRVALLEGGTITAVGTHRELLASVPAYRSILGQEVLLDLRTRVFDHFQRLSLAFHERYTSGRVISRLTSDMDAITEVLDGGLEDLATAVLSIVSIAVIILLLDVPLGLVTLAVFPLLVWLSLWFRSRSAAAYRRTREAIALVIVHFTESLGGIRAVQAAFLLYLRRFFDPMQELSQFYNSLQSGGAAVEKLAGVLEEGPSVAEPERPVTLAAPAGAVRFSGVRFGYRRDRPVIPDLDLEIPAGQTVALVGATGAGKTTIARLLARFYDPVEGTVTLDGVDLRRLAEHDLRRAVVIVTQESFLFSAFGSRPGMGATVADNIRLGRPNATRAEVEAAARAIGAHEFIASLPDGYDTEVRKRGGRLSAGQRQLVSFARAFIADPTAVIIAHRLSTVEIADRVLVLDQGRIVEDGPPDELVRATGRYADLRQAWIDSLV